MTPSDYKENRKEIARFMRRLYKRGLTTASGGNISVRFKEGILITPSALDKGVIKGSQIGMIAYDGRNLTPALKPSIECAMHLAIYKTRPDVQAIVHAHPPLATSFTALDKGINCSITAEARAILGSPVKAQYALMGSLKLAENVAKAASSEQSTTAPDVILLENHGIVCLGKDLLAAFDRLEVLEAAAKMTIITSLMGNLKQLNQEQLHDIDLLVGNA
jgi:L-fuculose-phosphate aldolase